MSASKSQTLSPPTSPHPKLRRRVLRMVGVWSALGAVMGTTVGMETGGVLGAAAGMVAGMAEMAALGALFGFIGGRPEETILGAVGGLLVGLTVGVVGGPAPVVLVANFGLVFGAIAGATLRAYVRLLSLPVLLLGRMLRLRHPRPALVTLRRDKTESETVPSRPAWVTLRRDKTESETVPSRPAWKSR